MSDAPTHIGPYRIVGELGRGGMGTVYKARDERLDRFVAVKVLSASLLHDDEAVERFLREAKSGAALTHPNVVQIHSVGTLEDGRPYLVMEHVPGGSLEQWVREKGAVEEERSARWMRDAATGLAAAHDSGLLHRDVKPGNLMLCPDERLKIGDFGLALSLSDAHARLTASGILMGTPGYLAPEQCEGAEPDPRTDIYSLGVTWYELLTGRLPFSAPSPAAVLVKILREEPESLANLRPDGDPEIHRMVEKMMAKRPADRYQDASELVADLERYLGFPTQARRGGVAPGMRPLRETSPTTAVAAVVPPPIPLPVAAAPAPVEGGRSLRRPWIIAAAAALLLMAGLASASREGGWVYEILNPGEEAEGSYAAVAGIPAEDPSTVAPVMPAADGAATSAPRLPAAVPGAGDGPSRGGSGAVPPPPARSTGTAVVVVGDPLFTADLESFLEDEMERRGESLADERALPGADALDRIVGDDPSVPPGAVSAPLAGSVARVVLVRVEYLESRELLFLGRAETAHQALVSAEVVDARTGDVLRRTAPETVEYTAVSAAREAGEVAGKLAGELVGGR